MAEKKDSILHVLRVLEEHTDKEHRLTSSDIREILINEYDYDDVDTRTIDSNVDILNEFLSKDKNNARINCIYKNVKKKDGGIAKKRDGYFIERRFDDSELALIIDSILSSKSIPEKQCKDLIEKLQQESNKYFNYKKNYMIKYTSGLKVNKEFFLNVEMLAEAIEKNRKVAFKYCDYNINKELKPRVDKKTGKAKLYTLTPLRMVINNGRYYLFGVPDIKNEISIYRVDKMADMEILNDAGIPKNQIKLLKDGMDLGKHIAEHIFMNIGPSEVIVFDFNSSYITSIVDWFGADI